MAKQSRDANVAATTTNKNNPIMLRFEATQKLDLFFLLSPKS